MPLITPTFKPNYFEDFARIMQEYYPEISLQDLLEYYSPKILQDGIVVSALLNCNLSINNKLNKYPFDTWELSSYGVCDNFEQIIKHYDFLLQDKRNLSVILHEINAEHQPEKDGWRWCRWGKYIGDGQPTCEYIFDEKILRKVFIYHIYELLD